MSPTREIYWNITGVGWMYALLVLALAVFAYGIYRRYRLWRLGRPEDRLAPVAERLRGLLVYGFGQARLLKRFYAGLFHSLLFFGFVVLFLGTVVVVIHEDFGLRIMQGNFYLFFQSLALDLFGLLATIAVGMAFYHRYLMRPERLGSAYQDGVILASLFVILVTGFMVEGLRIVLTEDPWGSWSPVGLVVGKFLASIFSADLSRSLHAFLWWGHLVLVLGLMAWLPYSKLLHLLTAPANIYLRSLEPKGAMLKSIDMESAESFGVKSIDQLTWKGLLDLDACTECGRCQEVCPAFAAGKPLSPKALIVDLREHLSAHASPVLAGGTDGPGLDGQLIGKVISEEVLWSCTTCMACMQECPVFIEHVPKIVDMRRHLVMEEGRFPDTMQRAIRSLEARGHPYPGTLISRTEWCQGMDVKILADVKSADYLYWVGCTTALHARNQKIAQSFARLLKRAGVDFAILGDQEHCTGDAARRIGNEYLFEKLARRNLKTLESYGVKKIVTACPHCFNTLKHEYAKLGAEYEVLHHSQLLAELVQQGRLMPSEESLGTVTFHDPCYLGRYNDTYEEPRKVIAAASKGPIAEMRQNRERSFCCGAGGGLMWMEEPNDKRVNYIRAGHALQSGADVVGAACPFCMIMLEDGVKSKGGERIPQVKDIAELLDARSNG
jgi:Fe-S oxidoreductase/nitrate reductase gamma subunit